MDSLGCVTEPALALWYSLLCLSLLHAPCSELPTPAERLLSVCILVDTRLPSALLLKAPISACQHMPYMLVASPVASVPHHSVNCGSCVTVRCCILLRCQI